jgi:diguanylate cyclase (GGDEF)-like protein
MLPPEAPRSTASSHADARFRAFRSFIIRLGFAVAVVPTTLMLLWFHGTHRLLPGMVPKAMAASGVLLLFPIATWAGIRRSFLPWFLYGGTGVALAATILDMARVSQGYDYYLWLLLYPCILTPLLSLPFRLWENALGMLVFLLVPMFLKYGGFVPDFPLMYYFAMMAPVFSVSAYFKHLMNGLMKANEAYRSQIEGLAHLDGLTGTHNRRFFMEEAQRMLKQAQRGQRETCLIMFDIDHFKRINDRHGHGMGDQAIMAAAHLLQRTLRETDLVARYGGEEFVALLPDADLASAQVAAERVRAAIEASRLPLAIGEEPLQFTASLGVARAEGPEDTLPALLDRADKALYAAKDGGRNRVEVAS